MGGGSGPSENPRYIPINLRTSDGDTVAPVIKQNSRQFASSDNVKPVIVSSDGGSFMTMGAVADQSDPFLLNALPFNYTDANSELPISYKVFPGEPIKYSATIENLPSNKGWKFTSDGNQTITWQENEFTLTSGMEYNVGFGSDGKPIISTSEDDLVVFQLPEYLCSFDRNWA